jgi:hypothetical protein
MSLTNEELLNELEEKAQSVWKDYKKWHESALLVATLENLRTVTLILILNGIFLISRILMGQRKGT